jgi:Putative phage metallopeptidase
MVRTAFDEIRLEEYDQASDAAQLGLLLINQVKEHEHLQAANIGYVFRDDELRRHGKVIAAEAIMVDRILQAEKRWGRIVKWALQHHILKVDALPDLLILIDRNMWSGYDADQKLALIDHELSHCWYETEEDGETQKFSRDGSPKWALRGHDVEEFCGVIARRGLWNAQLVEMARTMINTLSAAQAG